jgi:hypothetical protein
MRSSQFTEKAMIHVLKKQVSIINRPPRDAKNLEKDLDLSLFIEFAFGFGFVQTLKINSDLVINTLIFFRVSS